MIYDLPYWGFLLFFVPVYWLVEAQSRKSLFSAVSLAFICYISIKDAIFLFLMSLLTWVSLDKIAEKGRTPYIYALLIILLIVAPVLFFKFSMTYGIPSINDSSLKYAMPLGMSYYAFRLIHVVLDAYNFKNPRPRAPEFFSYAFCFTILFAGPISRFDAFQDSCEKKYHPNLMRDGLTIIMWGFIKQGVVIQGIESFYVESMGSRLPVGQQFLDLPYLSLWGELFRFYLVSYFNLGAYTDIAIGTSLLFGFRISNNFNYPLFAQSLSDFWSRWHMTLSSWCRDYVFLPALGITRQPIIALLASFLVMGCWHTPTINRVMWALYHVFGLWCLSIYRRYNRNNKKQKSQSWFMILANCFVTQLFIVSSFVFVVLEDSNEILISLRLLARLLTFGIV